MNGIDLVEKLAEMRRQYDNAHRPVHSAEHYRKRHARRHPERSCDSDCTFRVPALAVLEKASFRV